MGAAEEQTPSSPSKPPSSAQETPTTIPPYADWSSMQAYYNAAAQLYYASTAPAPTPHPYMWPGQQPMMTPYGTPVHYPALYPPGGVYAHPNIGMIANTANTTETEGKSSDVKDQTSAKKCKGISGSGNEKVESRKANSGSANDGTSHSAESGSEGSSDTSDDNNNRTEHSIRKGSFDLMLKDGANAHGPVTGNPVQTPVTNLNIGMDLWNGNAAGAVNLRPSNGVSSGVVPSMVMGEICYDERELKKQKRKQSNRESARRSRLRKQAECEELQKKVECLNGENSVLKDELRSLAEECMKLTAENSSIQDFICYGKQEEIERMGKK